MYEIVLGRSASRVRLRVKHNGAGNYNSEARSHRNETRQIGRIIGEGRTASYCEQRNQYKRIVNKRADAAGAPCDQLQVDPITDNVFLELQSAIE